MGLLFGDEVVYAGAVSTNRIFDSDMYTPLAKKALFISIKNNTSLVSELIKSSLLSPSISLKKFYDNHQAFEALFENVYPTGLFIWDTDLADGSVLQTFNYQEMMAMLDSIYVYDHNQIPLILTTYDQPTTNLDSDLGKYRKLTPKEWGIFVLGKTYYMECEYTPIEGSDPTFTYVEDGYTKTLTSAIANGANVTLTINYGFQNSLIETKIVSGYNPDHYYVPYTVYIGPFGGPPTGTVLFVYDVTANKKVVADIAIDSSFVEYGSLFPVIPIKRFLNYMDDPSVTPFSPKVIGLDISNLFKKNATQADYIEYVEKALKTVGFSFSEFKRQLQDAEAADVGDSNLEIIFSSFTFTANVHCTTPEVVKYLYHFFDYLREKKKAQLEYEATIRGQTITYTDANMWNEPLVSEFRMQDTSTRKMACRKITKTLISTAITNAYESVVEPDWINPVGGTTGRLRYKMKVDDNSHYLITVEGLEFLASYPLATSDGYRVNQQGNTYYLSTDDTSLDYVNAVVPFHKPTVDLLSFNEQEVLSVHGATLIVYAVNKIHLEWYQSSRFGLLLQFIAIVGIFFGVDTTSISAFITSLLTSVAYALALQKVLEFIAKEIGDPFLQAVLTAVTAYVYIMYGMGDASDAIKAIKAVDIISQSYFTIEFVQLTQDWKEFQETKDSLEAFLEEADNNLYDRTGISAEFLVAIEQFRILNVPPTEFFAKHLQTNPGINTLNWISNYTSNALDISNIDLMEEDISDRYGEA